jgi:MFS family permease
VAAEVLQRSGRAVVSGGRFVRDQIKRGAGAVHRFTISGGAGESGLARLLHLQFLAAAGDAAVAVSLAGTLFFTLPTDQARPQVAQFLLLTMAPFAIVAPFIGPFLDRFRHGRRWAIGVTLALRGWLCWVLADELHNSLWLFPAALGCLVASKAFTVTQASAIPRLLPGDFTLVSANSRISMAKVCGAAVGGGLAVAISVFGQQWSMRFGFVIFVAATVLAILLSPKVDSSAGERDIGGLLALPTGPETDRPANERVLRRFRSLRPSVLHGLRCVMGARLMTGFLTLFLAFLLRDFPISNLDGTVVLGVVVAAAGVGNSLGTVAGNLAKNMPPERIAVAALFADVIMAGFTAVLYSVVTVILLGLLAGFCSQLAKLSYDALVQRDVPEVVRTSVFARSETVIQICWVFGGALGISLPLIPQLGFGVVALLLCGLLVWTFLAWRKTLPQDGPPSVRERR